MTRAGGGVTASILAAVLVLGGLRASDVRAESVTISPPSGTYTTTQAFDVALIVTGTEAAIVGGNVRLNGVDITALFGACAAPGTVASGGRTFRCPGVGGGVLGPGTHTLAVTVVLGGGSSVSRSVIWEVLAAVEP